MANSSTHGEHKGNNPYRNLRERLKHFTWAWFSTNMATGAIAALLHQTPHKFPGLITIGKVIFLINIVLFCTFCLAIAFRFRLRPRALNKSLYHPTESFFFGAFWVSIALILENISQYGSPSCGPWLPKALEICFWCYGAAILFVGILQYNILFSKQRLQISDMMPGWILPIYPMLVTGPLAGTLLDNQPPGAGMNIWIGGVVFQGLGWSVTTFFYVLWTMRLLSYEVPPPSLRPGMYIAVGPTGYTSLALITLASKATDVLPYHFLGTSSTSSVDILRVIGIISGIFIWLLSFWFFSLTTVAILQDCRKMSFNLSWWAFIFPNAGLTLSTIQIGKVLDSVVIEWITSVMTVILFLAWLLIGFFHIRAVWNGQILWPGKDEDAGMET